MDTSDNKKILVAAQEIFIDRIPFNRVLGLEIQDLSTSPSQLCFNMRDDLVGNYVRGFLHGGVISGALDVAGGIAAFVSMLRDRPEQDIDTKIARFGRLGTIDLRIDYLRPGTGLRFTATAETMRAGKRVSVMRMELHNENQRLIAIGTAAYIVD